MLAFCRFFWVPYAACINFFSERKIIFKPKIVFKKKFVLDAKR